MYAIMYSYNMSYVIINLYLNRIVQKLYNEQWFYDTTTWNKIFY